MKKRTKKLINNTPATILLIIGLTLLITGNNNAGWALILIGVLDYKRK